MEEENKNVEVLEELEVQTTLNSDSLEVLVDGDDCTVENENKEEVEENANENI